MDEKSRGERGKMFLPIVWREVEVGVRLVSASGSPQWAGRPN